MSNVEDLPGGINKLEGSKRQEAMVLLNTCLAHLAEVDGPSYKVIKDLYRFQVELDNGTDIKPCSVEIWQRSWLKENGINIKIKFAGQDGELERTW